MSRSLLNLESTSRELANSKSNIERDIQSFPIQR